MSTTHKTQAAESITSGFNMVHGISDSMRDLAGLQFRTAQFMTEKGLSFGQTVSDFYQNQMTETVRVSQEFAKFGWSLTENLKKTAFEISDRAIKGFNQ